MMFIRWYFSDYILTINVNEETGSFRPTFGHLNKNIDDNGIVHSVYGLYNYLEKSSFTLTLRRTLSLILPSLISPKRQHWFYAC